MEGLLTFYAHLQSNEICRLCGALHTNERMNEFMFVRNEQDEDESNLNHYQDQEKFRG
jgi:predicted LPLAT superfamily acyltransferase